MEAKENARARARARAFFTEDFSSVEEELAQMLVPAIDGSF